MFTCTYECVYMHTFSVEGWISTKTLLGRSPCPARRAGVDAATPPGALAQLLRIAGGPEIVRKGRSGSVDPCHRAVTLSYPQLWH